MPALGLPQNSVSPSTNIPGTTVLTGANSIFYGDKLLTTGNPDTEHDQNLFRRLKISAEPWVGAEAGGGQPAAIAAAV